jgi:hypothetical protein
LTQFGEVPELIFHSLELILVLMQFVRVLLNMASDLGFFSIVWGVLILAFSTAMLGAGARDGIRDQQDHRNIHEDGDGKVMTSWSTWWFLQTYLQSLGQVNWHHVLGVVFL